MLAASGGGRLPTHHVPGVCKGAVREIANRRWRLAPLPAVPLCSQQLGASLCPLTLRRPLDTF